MHVENYFTFKRALDLNLIKKESKANIKMHEILNEKAVEVLTRCHVVDFATLISKYNLLS